MKRYLLPAILCLLAALSCNRQDNTSFSENKFRRSLEQAIELSEKIQEERSLIEQVALTQGTDAAAHLHDSIHYRQHIDALQDILNHVETLSNQLDTTHAKDLIARYSPYLDRLVEVFPPECGTIERVW